MKNFCTALVVLLSTATVWAASKSRPEQTAGEIFKKVSPNIQLEASLESLESRYGRRVLLILTAKKNYDNLKYKIQFHPEIELLESSPLEGQASLVESESLILKFTFDTRDISGPVALQITAYEEMTDRKRHGVTEMFEIYRPVDAMKSSDQNKKLPQEKFKRIYQ